MRPQRPRTTLRRRQQRLRLKRTLEAAVKTAEHSSRDRKPRAPREARNNVPNNMLYIGNLYYEVTADQLKRVFSRFGEIESVKIVYDNRGMSRG
jgi:nucleolin